MRLVHIKDVKLRPSIRKLTSKISVRTAAMFLEFLIIIHYYKFQSKHCAGRSESNTQESYIGILDFEKIQILVF
jgi:hypothetical protein